MADSQVIGQLGGFALGEVLSQLELDPNSIDSLQGQLGIQTPAFSRDSIYNGKFVDDDMDDAGAPYDPVTDLEAQVDREMYDERFQKKRTTTALGAAGAPAKLMRGEEDDFDDDEDEEDAGAADGVLRVKDEPMEQDDLFGEGATPGGGQPTPASGGRGGMGAYEDDEERYKEPSVEPAVIVPPPMKKVDVKELFPQFDHGKVLDFTDLFSNRKRASKRAKKTYSTVKLALPTPDELPRARSTRDLLLAPLRHITRESKLRSLLLESREKVEEDWEDEGSSDEELLNAIEESERHTKAKWVVPTHPEATFEMVELDSWEDRIIWGPDQDPLAIPAAPSEPLAPRNAEFEKGDWVKSIIWDKNSTYRDDFTKLNLNLNDTRMLLEVQTRAEGASSAAVALNVPTTVREQGLDPFNLSNDRQYEVTKETKKRVRQTFGLLEVQHAYPAQKLQLPFYKTRLTKSDCRAFHRPPLQFPSNIPITFTKVRSSKKKKDKSGRKIKKSEGESLRTMLDLSCRDTSNFVLLEYSEENPPVISNVGMGSILVNYYRKRDATDDFVPQVDIGEPFLLDPSDESPFKSFGHVRPGQTVPTLYNNLIRAPLFRHKPAETDFLVVKNTIEGEAKYYLREIKTAFVVGQTYPLVEIPGPNSRRVTNLTKARLQTIAWKLIERSPNKSIKVSQLTRYFADQNDLQMRQRLKEFMEYRQDKLAWEFKPSLNLELAEILKRATPEEVCLCEAMQVGLRHLQDSGYADNQESGAAGEDDSKLDIEQQLAPWSTTKNFIHATANKAMLKLHGDGDPTGRGEAFSFLRVSMKDIFLRAGEDMADRLAQMENRPKSAHRYNVQEQQDVYKEEISRIWKAQYDSLSNPVPPELTQDDEDRARGRGKFRAPMPMESAVGTPRDVRGSSPGSRGSSMDRDDGMSVTSGRALEGQNKLLRVKRLVNGQWETEIVRDPGVIRAYVRQRQMIDDEKTDADDLRPSDDEGKNERRKKRLKEQLEKLKRNQERRLTRKNQKLGIPTGSMGLGGKKIAAKVETNRVCGNCGQRGHMKTSKRNCPRWAEFNAVQNETSTALPLAFSGFSGGLALPSMAPAPAPAPAPKPSLKVTLGQ